MTKILYACDGSGRFLVETLFDEGDGLTIRTIPDRLFGPKSKRKRRKRPRPKDNET